MWLNPTPRNGNKPDPREAIYFKELLPLVEKFREQDVLGKESRNRFRLNSGSQSLGSAN